MIGWRIEDRPAGPMDYRMVTAADGGHVAGLAGISLETPAAAATPGWRFYIGVDDVDATADAIVAAGGSISIPPFDLPGVGRMAFVADPGGVAFFVMRGASEGTSTAFDRTGVGKCNWNELASPDQPVASAFYANVFGWNYPDKMTMPGDMGDYVFVSTGVGETIGATMTAQEEGPRPGWSFYFRVPDIDAAADRVRANGGTVLVGPQEVPGGDRIIVAGDAEDLTVGIVGPAAA